MRGRNRKNKREPRKSPYRTANCQHGKEVVVRGCGKVKCQCGKIFTPKQKIVIAKEKNALEKLLERMVS